MAASELALLRKRSKQWLMGWVVAGLMTLIAVFLGAYSVASYHSLLANQARLAEIRDLQDDQRELTEKFALAWRNQQQTADLLITWGEYVKERTKQTTDNLKSGMAKKGL